MKEVNSKVNSSLQLRKGAMMSYITMFFYIVTGLLYTPWMINQIGQSDYGLYSLALSLISFFTIDFGLGESVSKFLSKYNTEENDVKKKEFLGIIFKIYIVLAFIIFIAMTIAYLFVDIIYSGLTPEELTKFKVVFIIAALYSIASFPFLPLNGILISYERFVFIQTVNLINKVLTVSTMVVVLILGFELYSLVIVNAIVGLISILMKLSYINRNRLMEININANDKLLVKEIFSFSVWMAFISIAQRFIINITPTIIAAFTGSIQVALFAIAMTIEGYIWTFANALNGLFLPKVTRIVTKNENREEVENLMIKIGRIQLILIGLIIISFLLLGQEFLALWIGESFIDSYFVTIVLIFPLIITMTQQIGNTALIATNKVKYRAYCFLIAVIFSLGLSLILTQFWGALGSGIAIFIGNTIGIVVGLNIVYYKRLKINIFRFFKECHFKLIIPLLYFSAIGYFIQIIMPADNWFLFIIKALIFVLLYAIIMWKIALNTFEKDLFAGVINQIIRLR